MGYRGEECSGGRTLLRTHGEKLQLARGISAKSRNSSVALGELGVEMAERETDELSVLTDRGCSWIASDIP
jgi:hypothetical protein